MAGPPNSEISPNSPDVNGLRIGTRIGEFEVVKRIGEGGFSVVYLAWDHSLERNVALKEYMPMSIASRVDNTQIAPMTERQRETFDVALASFINEGKLLAQFDHPSLVKVYRFWEANGTAYMVMPFYEGKTLRDTIRALEGPPEEDWFITLLQPLTRALSVIHTANCYHRDIAPDNVMLLAGSGAPLLLDFGAARRVIGDRTQALTAILKPGYAPIEQYAEVPHLRQGSWTDVYALAAVIYWAIKGSTPPSAVGRMMKDSYVPLAESAADRYSQQFLKTIDRALKVLPEDRTQTVDDFRRDMGLDGGEGEPAAEPPPPVDSEETILVRAPSKPRTAAPAPSEATVFSGVPAARPVPSGDAAAPQDLPAVLASDNTAASEPPPPATPPPPTMPAPAAESVPASAAAAPATRSFPLLAMLAGVSLLVIALAVWWWLQRPQPAAETPPIEVAKIPEPVAEPVETPASQAPLPKPEVAPPVPVVEPTVAPPPPPPPPPQPVAIDVANLRSSFQLGGDPLRFDVTADEASYLYVFGHRDGSDSLELLMPAGKNETFDLAAGKKRQLSLPAKALEAQSPGAWQLWLIASRTKHDWNATEWSKQEKQFTTNFDPRATNDRAEDWLEPFCAAASSPCDRGIGVRKLALMTQAAPRPVVKPTPAPVKPAPKPTPPVRKVEAPTPPANNANAAECARIIQRLSIGDGGAQLAKRMQELGCR